MKKKNKIIIYSLLFIVVYLVFFFVFFNLVKPTQTDYNYHVFGIYIDDSYYGDFYRHNNIFRYLLDICHYFSFDLKISASLILALFVLIRFISIFFISNKMSIIKRALLSFALCLIMPINFGPVDQTYIGKFAGNIWHNPTYIAMMAFAPLCVYLFLDYFVNKHNSNIKLLLLSLSIFMCALSKPSFVIAFIPACAVYFIFDYFLFSKDIKILGSNILKGLLVCIPTFIFIIIAYLSEFQGGDNHIVFDFLGVWSFYAGGKSRVLINFLLSSIPGLVIIFINKQNKKNNLYYLILLFIGLIYFSLFAESINYYDANFAWTYASCILLFNTFLLIDYYSTDIKNKKVLVILISFIVLIECFSSFRYIVALVSGTIRF